MSLWSKISERMCEQIGVIKEPKISSQEGVNVPVEQKFLRGCVNRSRLLKSPRSQARKVSMSLWSKISESMCEQIWIIEAPKISSQEGVDVPVEQNF